jgi:hypothetical protein
LKINFCFLTSVKGFVISESVNIEKLNEDEVILHLQELCLHLALQLLFLISFLQDFILQQSFFSVFVYWYFEQVICLTLFVFLVYA